MSAEVRPGVPVYVARDCCGAYVGKTFTVRSVRRLGAIDFVGCRLCGYRSPCGAVVVDSEEPPSLIRATCLPLGWVEPFRAPEVSDGEVDALYAPSDPAIGGPLEPFPVHVRVLVPEGS